MIIWDDKYSTGVESIDKQHKMLFEFTNDLEMIIKDGRGLSYVTTSAEFLEKYVKAHFHFEEDCMFKHQCPIAGKNKEAHEKFLQAYDNFKIKLQSETYSDELLKTLHKFLENWITNHIMTIDVGLKNCVK